LIRKEGPDVLYYGCSHLHPEIYHDHDAITNKLTQDIVKSGLTAEEFANSRLILSTLEEGHCAQVLAPLAAYFEKSHSGRYLFLISPPVESSNFPVLGFTRSMVNHGNFLERVHQRNLAFDDVVVDKKFLCLIRRASDSRAVFASHLRKLILPNLRMSFGSMNFSSEISHYKHLFPGVELPILLDGQIDNSNKSKVYDVDDTFFQSVFNIVVESSSQHDAGIWRSIFITEKTFKAFAMYQIPVWFAVPGLVNEVRKLGLDVFDDIMHNHYYDQIQDHDQRQQALLELIQELDQTYDISLKKQMQSRLEDNYKKLFAIKQDLTTELTQTVCQYVKQGH
jgi:hypothetical protein